MACSVPRCKTGRSFQKKMYRAAGIDKNPACFSLPKIVAIFVTMSIITKCPKNILSLLILMPLDENLRKKWLEVLGMASKKLNGGTLHICEFHFPKSKIIKYNIMKMPDGTVWKMERCRTRLKPETLPLSSPRTDCNLRTNNTETDLKCIDDKKTPVLEKQVVEAVISPEHNSQLLDRSTSSSNADTSVCNKLCPDDVATVVYSPECITSALKHSPLSSDADTADCSALCADVPEPKVENDTASTYITEASTNMSLLLQSLKLPPHWSYSVPPNGLVEFTYVHPFRRMVYLSCIINSDMSVEVLTLNKHIKIICDVTLTSQEDVVSHLLHLQRLKCCEGLEIDNMFSKQCEGLLTSTANKTNKCQPCIQLRKSILRQQSNNTRSLKRLRMQKKILQSLAKQCLC